MTTPTLSESLTRLAGALPANPDDHGPVAVSSDDVRRVLNALVLITTTILATDAMESVPEFHTAWAELEVWAHTGTVTG